MALSAGQQAPDFELPDQHGNTVKLSDYQGDKPVALVFYVFAFSGICEGELCAIRDDFSRFEAAGVQVIALSCDARFAQKAFAESQGYEFPVLSDFWPHGETAKAYDVFNADVGCPMRAAFLIGADGTIIDVFETENLGTAREQERYEEALAKL